MKGATTMTLDEAWAAAEAALPEHHGPLVLQTRGEWGRTTEYTAWSYDAGGPTVTAYGPTPAAALQTLAARLQEKSA